jgi:predicted exporter
MVLAALAGIALSRADRPVFDSDLFSMVSAGSADKVRAAAIERVRSLSERRQTWVVQHPLREAAARAAVDLQAGLLASGLFRTAVGAEHVQPIFAFYDRYRFRLVDDESLRLGRSGADAGTDAGGELALRVQQALYSTGVALPALDMTSDPFLLHARFLAALGQVPDPYQVDRGLLARRDNDGWTYLVPVELTGSAFDFEFQAQVEQVPAALVHRLEQNTGASIASVGAIDFASANRRLALREAGLIGGASLLLIIGLLTLTFRHARPFLAVACTISAALVGGFSVCLLAFGSIHLLTLVGGSSLIGMAVDYTFHALSDGYRNSAGTWVPTAGLERVLPPVTLGLATSLLGFLGLYASGFGGLQQIALFSGAGLTTAWLTLIFCYPALLSRWRPGNMRPGLLRAAAWWSGFWRPRRRSLMALGACAVLLAWLTPALETSSDIRLLAARSPAIDTLLAHSRTLSASLLDSRFFLVHAPDTQSLLRREEALRERLMDAHRAGAVSHFYQVSRFVPSLARQDAALALNHALYLAPGTAVETLIDQIGLNAGSVRKLRSRLESDPPAPLTLDDFLASPLAPLAGQLYLGHVEGGHASLVTLAGVTDVERLRATAANLDGVAFVDNVATISDLFGRYVDNAIRGLLIAFVLVTGLMILRFGVREGSLIMLVPLVAFVFTLFSLQILGESINLFHIVGLALVLGAGMDYTLFLRSGNAAAHTMLAVLLAALTTECAFGLLSLSEVRAIHSFGTTVAIGTALTFLLAPMVSDSSPAGRGEGA